MQKKIFVWTVIAVGSAFYGWSCANVTSERTLILLKPDTVNRGLIGRIIQRFEDKGLKLVAMKFVRPTEELFEEHYRQRREENFYTRMIQYLTAGPIIPMVWEGLNATSIGRQLIGSVTPLNSLPAAIRGCFDIFIERSIIHGSSSVEAANREINLWFQDNEFVSWTPSNSEWIYGPTIN